MAKTRAVIHIVRAEQGAVHFLQEIVVFVGRFGAAIDCHRIGAIALINAHKVVGNKIQGGFPVGLHPVPIAGEQRADDWKTICTHGKNLLATLRLGLAFEQVSAR